MKGEDLRAAILALLDSHPSVSVSPAGHAKHALRYVTAKGLPIGFEPRTLRFQNVWVRTDSVRKHRLADIDSRYYAHADFHVSKPNHDLFREPAFKDADLVCFKVQDLWQAVRVIAEVAGSGSGT